MQKILVLMTEAGDGHGTEKGQSLLRDFRIPYQLRVASAQLAPDYVKELVAGFQKQGGQVIICFAPPLDYLASLVSSLTALPVLSVLRTDAPLPMEQLPGPIPVAHIGLGAQGFAQSALFAIQLLALADPELYQNLHRHRHSLAAQTIAADQQHRVIFDVQA